MRSLNNFINSITHSSSANTKAAAKLSAMELAKIDLPGQLGSNIAGLVESSLANNQIAEEDATSVQKVIAAATHLISTSLGRVLVFSEFYRKMFNGNVQWKYSMRPLY